jgi:hypothetical protein
VVEKRKKGEPLRQKAVTQTTRVEVSASEAEASNIVEARRPPGIGGKYILRKWTYHVPSSPISPEKIKETFTADVIVVGAGTSGKVQH